MLPWRRHAPHPLPGPGSRAWCLRFSPLTHPLPPPHPSLSNRDLASPPGGLTRRQARFRNTRGCLQLNSQEQGGLTLLQEPAPSRWGAGAATAAPRSPFFTDHRGLTWRAHLSSHLPPTSAQMGLRLPDGNEVGQVGRILHPSAGPLLNPS